MNAFIKHRADPCLEHDTNLATQDELAQQFDGALQVLFHAPNPACPSRKSDLRSCEAIRLLLDKLLSSQPFDINKVREQAETLANDAWNSTLKDFEATHPGTHTEVASLHPAWQQAWQLSRLSWVFEELLTTHTHSIEDECADGLAHQVSELGIWFHRCWSQALLELYRLQVQQLEAVAADLEAEAGIALEELNALKAAREDSHAN